MQISVDVHNYMETLIGALLADDAYTDKYNSEQLADLACLALNQLRPIYIRHDIDFLSSLAEERLVILHQQAMAAVESAETMILDDRRQLRHDDDIPYVSTELRRLNDEIDDQLEWFETPILSPKSKK
jgi:hypothetical protein